MIMALTIVLINSDSFSVSGRNTWQDVVINAVVLVVVVVVLEALGDGCGVHHVSGHRCRVPCHQRVLWRQLASSFLQGHPFLRTA